METIESVARVESAPLARAAPVPSDSALYRRVWRWHFYAGLICLPFLALMALTGALYLYHEPIESLVYARLRFVEPAPGPQLRLRDDRKLAEVIKQIHSLTMAGTVANHWIEIVAGWAIVLVVSGVFLWWPRGRPGGVWSVRGRPAQRTRWRDLHAVTGVFAAAAILFLAVTGMPWSAFWEAAVRAADDADYGVAGRLTEWGVNLHTGVQFGWPNRLVMLAGCLSIIVLALSAVVMWWKRRPRGKLAAPPRRAGDRAALGAIAVALLLGLLYPLLGASMFVALLVDALVPRRWHERFGL